MGTPTILLGVRVVDPLLETDRVADVLVADGIVQRIEASGSALMWPEHPNSGVSGTAVIPPSPTDEYLLVPGLVDSHTHAFGSAGVSRADAIGVEAGVPSIVDAGGAGAATIEDFVSLRVEPSKTDIYSLLSIECGGVTDRHMQHNTTKRAEQMVTSSIDSFLGAIDRHCEIVVGLKLWSSTRAGLRWIDHGVNLSEMTSLPMMVHVGENIEGSEESSVRFTGDVLDRLQGGDVVTHSFTGLRGSLVSEHGKVAAEVIAARDRGVLFDIAPGLENLCFDRATAALESGWIPDTISSDVHKWMTAQYDSPALLRVMSSFLALGLSLPRTIQCASTNAASAFGITTGRPMVGSVATLSLLSLDRTPTIFSDGVKSIHGAVNLAPVGCFLRGEWIEAGTTVVASEPEDGLWAPDVDRERFFEALSVELSHHRDHDDRWRGLELHQLVHRARRDCRLSIADAIRSFYAEMAPEDANIPVGWFLEELGPGETIKRLELAQTR